jgi:ankyrin repeat protein
MQTYHKNDKEFIKFLIEHGADPNIEDHDGYTSLFYECKKRERVIMIL